ncbi:MAG: MFS transporter [Acetobacteraceae bacterium]|nr:MFS transporter [Acetobacteraceae bacterium]
MDGHRTVVDAAPGLPPAPGARVAVLLAMCLGVLIAQVDMAVVNLAVKHIGADLDAGVSALQWVIDGYNLAYASFLMTGGTLGDLYGRRKIFALGIVLFTAGSLLCGLAPNGAVLIAGRALTGLVWGFFCQGVSSLFLREVCRMIEELDFPVAFQGGPPLLRSLPTCRLVSGGARCPGP